MKRPADEETHRGDEHRLVQVAGQPTTPQTQRRGDSQGEDPTPEADAVVDEQGHEAGIECPQLGGRESHELEVLVADDRALLTAAESLGLMVADIG